LNSHFIYWYTYNGFLRLTTGLTLTSRLSRLTWRNEVNSSCMMRTYCGGGGASLLTYHDLLSGCSLYVLCTVLVPATHG